MKKMRVVTAKEQFDAEIAKCCAKYVDEVAGIAFHYCEIDGVLFWEDPTNNECGKIKPLISRLSIYEVYSNDIYEYALPFTGTQSGSIWTFMGDICEFSNLLIANSDVEKFELYCDFIFQTDKFEKECYVYEDKEEEYDDGTTPADDYMETLNLCDRMHDIICQKIIDCIETKYRLGNRFMLSSDSDLGKKLETTMFAEHLPDCHDFVLDRDNDGDLVINVTYEDDVDYNCNYALKELSYYELTFILKNMYLSGAGAGH